MITLAPDVGYLLKQLLLCPRHIKVFVPNWSDGRYHSAFSGEHHESYVTAITKAGNLANTFIHRTCDGDDEHATTKVLYDGRRRVHIHPRLELFNPVKKFHYGYCFSNFSLVRETVGLRAGQLKIVSQELTDDMLFYEGSRSALNPERKIPEHLMAMEQMYYAALVGGYFAAVLPKNWLGSNMRYAKWWNDTVATVARISLPSKVIAYTHEEFTNANTTLEEVQADTNVKWELVIWTKPSPRKQAKHQLLHAEFRWPTFLYTIHDFGDTENKSDRQIDFAVRSFRKNDWWTKHVGNWLDLLKAYSSNRDYGTVDSAPVELQDPDTIRIFKPSTKTRPDFKVAKTVTEIADDPYGIHIKPGPPIRVRPYHPVAISIWHDLEGNSPLVDIPSTKSKPGKKVYKFSYDLRRMHFSNCKEELIKALLERGLNPYILSSDLSRLKKQHKWLTINLTPVERCVKTKVIDPTNEDKDKEQWDWMYGDMGLKATHPELWKMWERRARKMKLHSKAFGFQFTDLVVEACHTSLLNSNVMGLGKTIQLLMLQMLYGIKQGLYVVPSSLLGVWQTEIETNIANYVMMAKRNWKGDRLYADYQIIEWGEQCLPSKLATFNLISYEKLGAIPRDSLFFKCPKCCFVVASARRFQSQPCPSPACENFGRRKRIKEINRIRGLKKYKERTADGQLRTVDERIHAGPLVMMEPLLVREKKFSTVMKGYDTIKIPGGINEFGLLPEYREEEKKVHLKRTFSELLRYSFNYVAVDEAVNVKNPDALRTKALYHLAPRHRHPATGTPVRGYPQSVLSLLNWAFRRSVFPDYRMEDRGAEARFLDKYGTMVYNIATGKSRLIPKANNPEQLRAELAPLMLRHTRDEPTVIKDIPLKKSIKELIPVKMDDQHRAFYQKWIDKFLEWFVAKKRDEGKKPAGGEIIVKMGYLRNASAVPHAMFDAMTKRKKKGGSAKDIETDADGASWAAVIGPYEGPPTQKQIWTRKLIIAIKRGEEITLPGKNGGTGRTISMMGGEKTLAFSCRRANSDAGQLWASKMTQPKIYSMIVDGRISNAIQASTGRSRKYEMIQQFCELDFDVMWAGLGALKEGHNIPCANHGIMMDYDWEPTVHRQAIGRMLRPQQVNTVNEYYLTHDGTIDDYMAALCILKGHSMDEVIDYMEFEGFGVEMIPDINQYAESIVDGTSEIKKARMWLAAEEILRKEREGAEDDE